MYVYRPPVSGCLAVAHFNHVLGALCNMFGQGKVLTEMNQRKELINGLFA